MGVNMENEKLVFADELEQAEERPIVEVEGVPYVDAAGVQHDDLVCFKGSNGCKVWQLEDGELYDEAVERVPCHRHYIETDEPLDPVEGEQRRLAQEEEKEEDEDDGQDR